MKREMFPKILKLKMLDREFFFFFGRYGITPPLTTTQTQTVTAYKTCAGSYSCTTKSLLLPVKICVTIRRAHALYILIDKKNNNLKNGKRADWETYLFFK